MKKILIWDKVATGHHVEWLEHLYSTVLADTKNQYIFCVNKDLFGKSSINWVMRDNIQIETLSESSKSTIGGKIELLKKILKYSPDKLFLMQITDIIPDVIVFSLLFWRIRIYGVLYKIYLYSWLQSSKAEKIKNIIIFSLYKTHVIKGIFTLNDRASARLLNRIWKTKKYIYLPDPLPIKKDIAVRDIRREKGISSDATVFLHCGALDGRKGTMKILNAIKELEDDRGKRVYCFVGVVNKSISDDYYKSIDEIKEKHTVFTDNSFVSIQTLCEYIKASDCIILPYSNTSQSSGIIAYASFYNKYAAVSRGGMLGHLVKKNNLGGCIESTKEGVLNLIETFRKDSTNREYYAQTHTYDDFVNTLMPFFNSPA